MWDLIWGSIWFDEICGPGAQCLQIEGYGRRRLIGSACLRCWLFQRDHRPPSFLRGATPCARVGSEYFQSTRVRVLSTSEVLEYEYEYFSPFYKSTRVRVQSTQNVLMNTLMSTFRC